jgi:hypothetical protein
VVVLPTPPFPDVMQTTRDCLAAPLVLLSRRSTIRGAERAARVAITMGLTRGDGGDDDDDGGGGDDDDGGGENDC